MSAGERGDGNGAGPFGGGGPSPEDPNRFPDDGAAPLDEAPDGRTPSDTNTNAEEPGGEG
jgi:hypothetical protein